MTARDLDRLEELFLAAGALPPEEREQYLDEQCDGHPVLRREVVQLLLVGKRAEQLLSGSNPKPAAAPVDLSPGTMIGGYQLLELVGEGGFGIVYRAEQKAPVRRQVALKLIKPGMDSKAVIARFEAERQALALMDHDNIARIFDGGMTPDGRPFFVMEFIRGTSITEFCDHEQLGTKARLLLIQQTCLGVQHAHQKGIIHRDLKPANILVELRDGRPVVKIIDFGVARALGQQLTEKTIFTAKGQLIGTLDYMSREQVTGSGLDIDTRADVYSLGAVLYEVLTGVKPFDLGRRGFDEMVRTVREDDPSKPSTRVSTLANQSARAAERRKTDPKSLTRQLRGDLDWITLKALEKDRDRRYSSAKELAEDIQRHLTDEPVLASPPGAIYRLGKIVRKHRTLVCSLAAILVILITALLITFGAKRDAERSLEQAEANLDKFDFVWTLFVRTLSIADTEIGAGREVTIFEALDRNVPGALAELDRYPELKPRFEYTVGMIYKGVGRLHEARGFLARAAEGFETYFGAEDRRALGTRSDLAALLQTLGEYDAAEVILRELLATRKRLLGSEDRLTLSARHDLALLILNKGDVETAAAMFRSVLEVQGRVLPKDHKHTVNTRGSLATALQYQGKYMQAAEMLREIVKIQRMTLRDEDPDALVTRNNLASILLSLRQREEAETILREALQILLRTHGGESELTLMVRNNLASALKGQGKRDEAAAIYRDVLGVLRKTFDEDHQNILICRYNLAGTLTGTGQLKGAEEIYRDVMETMRTKLGEEHPNVLSAKYGLANTIGKRGRFEESEAMFVALLEIQRRVFGDEHADTLRSRRHLKNLRRAGANSLKRRLAQAEQAHGTNHRETIEIAEQLVSVYLRGRRYAAAREVLVDVLERAESSLQEDDALTARLRMRYGICLTNTDSLGEAEEHLTRAYAVLRDAGGADHEDTQEAIRAIVALYERLERRLEAEEYRALLAGE